MKCLIKCFLIDCFPQELTILRRKNFNQNSPLRSNKLKIEKNKRKEL